MYFQVSSYAIYLEVSSTEGNGTYFQVQMHRIALKTKSYLSVSPLLVPTLLDPKAAVQDLGHLCSPPLLNLAQQPTRLTPSTQPAAMNQGERSSSCLQNQKHSLPLVWLLDEESSKAKMELLKKLNSGALRQALMPIQRQLPACKYSTEIILDEDHYVEQPEGMLESTPALLAWCFPPQPSNS